MIGFKGKTALAVQSGAVSVAAMLAVLAAPPSAMAAQLNVSFDNDGATLDWNTATNEALTTPNKARIMILVSSGRLENANPGLKMVNVVRRKM